MLLLYLLLLQFNEPSGVAVNSSGDILYIADTNNHVIKVIDAINGSITKVKEKKNVLIDTRGKYTS